MSLKVVKFDAKMYLNFSNFWERTPAGGGGTSLGPKTGTSVGWGGLAKFSPDGRTPSSPPGKKPCLVLTSKSQYLKLKVKENLKLQYSNWHHDLKAQQQNSQ